MDDDTIKQKESTLPHTHGLEVLDSTRWDPFHGLPHGEGKMWERRQLPRLCVTSEQFRLADQRKFYPVSDLSEGGMGLWIYDPEDLKTWRVGELRAGNLNFNRQKHSVEVRVRNISQDRVGCQFITLGEATRAALIQFLDPKALGMELKPIPVPIPSMQMNTLWYHGPSGTDLLLKRWTDGQFQKLTLFLLGTFVQWDAQEGVTSGRTLPSRWRSELHGIVRLETLHLFADAEPDPGKLSIAKKVILSSNLPKDLRTWCLRHLGA